MKKKLHHTRIPLIPPQLTISALSKIPILRTANPSPSILYSITYQVSDFQLKKNNTFINNPHLELPPLNKLNSQPQTTTLKSPSNVSVRSIALPVFRNGATGSVVVHVLLLRRGCGVPEVVGDVQVGGQVQNEGGEGGTLQQLGIR